MHIITDSYKSLLMWHISIDLFTLFSKTDKDFISAAKGKFSRTAAS